MTPRADADAIGDLALLRRVDRYLDSAPGASATPVDVGPLRVFLSSAPWPFYVRPRPDLDLTASGAITADDVRRAAEVLEAAGQDVSFEWVTELVPSLGAALVDAGLTVTTHPLLAFRLESLGPADPSRTGAGLDVRLLGADAREVIDSLAVSDIGFDEMGTAIGHAGAAERDACVVEERVIDHTRDRIRAGRSVVAVLEDPQAGVVATGGHQPVGDATEIVAVATLPAHRRRGAAGAVVAALLHDARERGITLALLSADDDAVARVYERLGFTRIGHCGAAAPVS